MREIKFRAWDKEHKRWTNYSIADDLPRFYDKHTGCWKTDRKGERFILCQYTGLKDISGIEIYEGDILIIGVNYDRERVCYVDSCYKNGSSRLEIVGNIYENPELLKERTNDN